VRAVFIAAPPTGYSVAGETARSSACGGPNESAEADTASPSVAHIAVNASAANRRHRHERRPQAALVMTDELPLAGSITPFTYPGSNLLQPSAILG
jgi:acyl-CoA reductase-like NAD-dependent aldehyde dehydrogenase